MWGLILEPFDSPAISFREEFGPPQGVVQRAGQGESSCAWQEHVVKMAIKNRRKLLIIDVYLELFPQTPNV